MKIKKKILPLAFLGLSPMASASATTTETGVQDPYATTILDSIGKKKPVPKDTFKININAIVPSDTISATESNKIIDTLVKRYNQTPDAFKIEDIYKLMNFMQNPALFYNKLNIPLNQAKQMAEFITPQMLKKLGLSEKKELISHAVENAAVNMSESDAYAIMADKELSDLIVDKADLYEKSLDFVLKDTSDILQNQHKKELIENCLKYATENQNNSQAINLYISIFEYTTNLIHNFYNSKDKEQAFALIRWLSNNIDAANKLILSGTKMDKEISIRIPSQAVLNDCRQAFNRLGLAKIYNDAYNAFLKTGGKTYPANYTSKNAHKIFKDYLLIIYYQHKKLNESERKELEYLKNYYPEVQLFEKYFSVAYLDMGNRDKIDYFAAKLNTMKPGSKIKYPKEVKESIEARSHNINLPIEIMKENGILVPNFVVSQKRTDFDSYIDSDVSVGAIFNKINKMLEQQIELVRIQEYTAQRLNKLQSENDEDLEKVLVQEITHGF